MNNMQVFNNENFGKMRTILIDGEPWFVANDVCEILNIVNPRTALTRLDDDEKGVHTVYTPGGEQQLNCINESGLYSLILTSRKPEAKKFKKWVTSEVLPSIRKTGSYSAKKLTSAEFLLETAKAMVELEQRIDQTEEKTKVLESRINNFDNLEMENKRQKLTSMVSKFAYLAGVHHQYAWKTFKTYFNNAYNTNIGLLITHFKRLHMIEKKVTVPEYLETVDRLDDAIRVADKMIQEAEKDAMVTA